MSKRKVVSAEEKRARILQIFHDSQDYFLLKEIERIASKEKGINAQYVKDIVQSLVDDGVVDSDKIGTSVFFWSYSSKLLNNKKMKIEDIVKRIEDTSAQLKASSDKLIDSKTDDEDPEEKSKLLSEIETLSQTESNMISQLKANEINDPERFRVMEEDTKCFKEAANRWTDNIFAIKSWCRKKYMIEESILNKQFSIPADLDYL